MKRWLWFRRSACILLAAAAALPSSLIAQADEIDAPDEPSQASETSPSPRPPGRVWRALKDEAKRYGRDSVALIKKPLSWKKKQWEKAGGALLVIGGLMLADKSIETPPAASAPTSPTAWAARRHLWAVNMDSTPRERCSPQV